MRHADAEWLHWMHVFWVLWIGSVLHYVVPDVITVVVANYWLVHLRREWILMDSAWVFN